MSKHNFQETLDNESDLRKTLGYNKVYNDLKNNFLVLKMHQNAPQSMQIFKIFWGRPPIPPLQEGVIHQSRVISIYIILNLEI